MAGTSEKGKKVNWRCVVLGCRSNRNINRHSFPKDVIRSEKWRQAIKNPALNNLTADELRYYKVCQIHFPESAYRITSTRQILREDAVPHLVLNICSSTTSKAKTCTDIISTDIEVSDILQMQEDSKLQIPLEEFTEVKSLPSWSDISE